MKQQVIINVGVSGSGKTTWSTEYIKNNPNTLRINRDDLRKTLVGTLDGYYQKSNLNKIEEEVNALSHIMLLSLLEGGFDVIIDNTHLRPKYVEQVIALLKAVPFEIDIKFKLFEEANKDLLKLRVSNRDSLPLNGEQIKYVDKQVQQLKLAVSYVKDNYPNQILE